MADEGTDYFEKNIRPCWPTRCYGCHSAKLSRCKATSTRTAKKAC